MDNGDIFQLVGTIIAGALGGVSAWRSRRALRVDSRVSVDGNGTRLRIEQAFAVLHQFKLDMQRENAIQNERITAIEGQINERLAAIETLLQVLVGTPWTPRNLRPSPRPQGNTD